MSSRVSVRRRSNFSTIPNSLIRNKDLSTDARVLIAYVMSCSESWTFYVSELQKILRCGKDKWQKTRKEAIDAGYLKITPKNGPDGRLDGYIWEVFDEPQKQDAVATQKLEPQDAVADANDREPENTASGEKLHREPEKPARRLDPPAGKSGSLRKNKEQKEKQTSCAADAPHHDDFDFGSFFDRIWRAYPNKGNWPDTEEAVSKLLDAGDSPSDIEASVKAYAVTTAGYDRQRVKLSQNFFAYDFWRKHIPVASKPVDQSKVLEARASDILSKAPWARTTISAHKAGECISAGLVTEEQCREAGIFL